MNFTSLATFYVESQTGNDPWSNGYFSVYPLTVSGSKRIIIYANFPDAQSFFFFTIELNI